MDDSFNWKWQLRGDCGEVSCTWGNWVFHWFMHFKQIYEPRETFGIILSLEITPLPTKPLPPDYPLRIPWAWTMGYKDNTWFCWIFNGFLLEIWTYTLVFLCVSQAPLLKVSKGPIKVLGPWCWFFLLHILWLDWDPSSCCMSSSLTKSRSSYYYYYYYYYYYFFLFPSFWDFGPSWSFLTS